MIKYLLRERKNMLVRLYGLFKLFKPLYGFHDSLCGYLFSKKMYSSHFSPSLLLLLLLWRKILLEKLCHGFLKSDLPRAIYGLPLKLSLRRAFDRDVRLEDTRDRVFQFRSTVHVKSFLFFLHSSPFSSLLAFALLSFLFSSFRPSIPIHRHSMYFYTWIKFISITR